MTEEEARGIVYNDLGLCGCGEPEQVLRFVHKALELIKKRLESDWCKESQAEIDQHFCSEESEKDNLFRWIAWYFIDRAGLIEHGSNIRNSWLTEKGKTFLQYLDAHALTQILETQS